MSGRDRFAAIHDALNDRSVLIVEHRFPQGQGDPASYGTYNVGILGFRNDAAGRACLQWWRERCLEWCYDRVEAGKYADQKYRNFPTTDIRNGGRFKGFMIEGVVGF